jgi:heme a synthase
MRLPTVSPRLYARISAVAFLLLVLIVFTGAAVRLTGSGLGCPTWPECHGAVIQTELDTHGAIEYGNRLLTGLVAFGAVAAFLTAFLRRPFRRDLAIIAALMPIGVAVQALLGGLSVLYGLAPGWVMRYEPATEPSNDKNLVLATRALTPLAAWVLFMGTVSTASGPHPGSSGTGEVVHRFSFHGSDTMTWVIHWHGRFSTLLGLSAVAIWFYARKAKATPQLRKALTVLCLLLASQGIVGAVQYESGLPAELVWVHVVLATCTWLAVCFSVAAAGRLAPATALDAPHARLIGRDEVARVDDQVGVAP